MTTFAFCPFCSATRGTADRSASPAKVQFMRMYEKA
jgi:hypothetical protein